MSALPYKVQFLFQWIGFSSFNYHFSSLLLLVALLALARFFSFLNQTLAILWGSFGEHFGILWHHFQFWVDHFHLLTGFKATLGHFMRLWSNSDRPQQTGRQRKLLDWLNRWWIHHSSAIGEWNTDVALRHSFRFQCQPPKGKNQREKPAVKKRQLPSRKSS